MNIARLASFMLDKIPGFRRWDSPTFVAWLGWHLRGGEVFVMEDERAILAVGIAHPIEKPEDAPERYKTSEHGFYLCFDALYAVNKTCARKLLEAVRKRFYRQHYVIFSRGKYSNRYRTYKIDDFMKKLGCYKNAQQEVSRA